MNGNLSFISIYPYREKLSMDEKQLEELLNSNINKEFVQRMLGNKFIDNGDGSISTHRMAAEIDREGRSFAFPMIVPGNGGELIEMKDPYFALEYNKSINNVIEFENIEQALDFSKNYKKSKLFKEYEKVITNGP